MIYYSAKHECIFAYKIYIMVPEIYFIANIVLFLIIKILGYLYMKIKNRNSDKRHHNCITYIMDADLIKNKFKLSNI